MTIAITALKEKIRRKELYIVSVIGVLILLTFGTGTGSISINGEALTDYKMLAPVLLIVVNAISCFLAIVMSISTIPNEYERNTSHLIWIRKIPQYRYHGELTLANIISGLISEAILFGALLIFMISQGKIDELFRLVPTYFIVGINVIIVSVMTSALSIIIPKFVTGAIAITITLVGIFHSLLDVFKDMIGGFGGGMIKYVLKVIPNLHGIQSEAANALCGNVIDVHTSLTGLLAVYVFTVLVLAFKRKEA